MARSIQKKSIDEDFEGIEDDFQEERPKAVHHSPEDSGGGAAGAALASESVDLSRDRERAREGIKKKKYLLACILLLVLSVATAFSYFKLPARHEPPPPQPQKPVVTGPTVIRHPIALPRHSRKYSFLILVGNGEKKDLIELSLECEFYGTGKKKDLLENSTQFRDVMYQYLKSRQPADNSQKTWLKIVETDLMEHLKTRFVEGRPNSIRMWRYIRL